MITTVKQFGTTILERIGNTPLVRLEALTAHLPGVQILGKAEWTNPGGSVKDRAAASIVTDAQRRGLINKTRGLLDATSGNTGIAYAMLGAAMGFPVTLCMPSNVSDARKRYLKAYGAEIVWTNPADGSDGAIRKARQMIAAEPDRYYGPLFDRIGAANSGREKSQRSECSEDKKHAQSAFSQSLRHRHCSPTIFSPIPDNRKAKCANS